jgi:hypothetical protein
VRKSARPKDVIRPQLTFWKHWATLPRGQHEQQTFSL